MNPRWDGQDIFGHFIVLGFEKSLKKKSFSEDKGLIRISGRFLEVLVAPGPSPRSAVEQITRAGQREGSLASL